MKILFTSILCLSFLFINAQQGKQIWAKSFLNKKAPELIIEKWLSEKPNTEGKFILIDFWATWCGPCKKAIPELNAYQKEFKDDLIIIGISDEPESKVLEHGYLNMEYFSAIDTKKTLNTSYKISGIPHCVLIDPNGIVRWEGWPHLKGFELTSKVIKDIIEKNKQK